MLRAIYKHIINIIQPLMSGGSTQGLGFIALKNTRARSFCQGGLDLIELGLTAILKRKWKSSRNYCVGLTRVYISGMAYRDNDKPGFDRLYDGDPFLHSPLTTRAEEGNCVPLHPQPPLQRVDRASS